MRWLGVARGEDGGLEHVEGVHSGVFLGRGRPTDRRRRRSPEQIEAEVAAETGLRRSVGWGRIRGCLPAAEQVEGEPILRGDWVLGLGRGLQVQEAAGGAVHVSEEVDVACWVWVLRGGRLLGAFQAEEVQLVMAGCLARGSFGRSGGRLGPEEVHVQNGLFFGCSAGLVCPGQVRRRGLGDRGVLHFLETERA